MLKILVQIKKNLILGTSNLIFKILSSAYKSNILPFCLKYFSSSLMYDTVTTPCILLPTTVVTIDRRRMKKVTPLDSHNRDRSFAHCFFLNYHCQNLSCCVLAVTQTLTGLSISPRLMIILCGHLLTKHARTLPSILSREMKISSKKEE